MPMLTVMIRKNGLSLLQVLLHIFTVSSKSAWPRSLVLLHSDKEFVEGAELGSSRHFYIQNLIKPFAREG